MKFATLMLFIVLNQLFSPAAVAEIKQLTVNDYLQRVQAEGKTANRLISESSPYLLQHAYNPVHWYAWGEAAFEKARSENKPIFLSIGYSTCHWCHVMAHESFENERIATLLNKNFVAVKVDREQRPDIDAIYMSATQLISGHGGWPMTVFVDEQLRPFHAATYYPPFSSEKGTGLEEVLLTIHDLWSKQPEKIDAIAAAVTARISELADDTTEGGVLDDDVMALALQQISAIYDEDDGGFSAAPKFPSPGIFDFLNQLLLQSGNAAAAEQQSKSPSPEASKAKNMMKTTLHAMATGGIYDQVGGGFHRYAVDAGWQVPHFEKMLYSQALMLMAYTGFYEIEPQQKYRQLVYQTVDFVLREMRSADGGFYSALDADSERADKPGQRTEGAYYLWPETELKKSLSDDEYVFVKKYYQIEADGNIESDPQQEFSGLNILSVAEDYRDIPLTEQQQLWLSAAHKKLLTKRFQRPRPHLDDKVITAWNGMMLVALARAAMVFDEPVFLQRAAETAAYVKKKLYQADSKRLLRQHRETAGKLKDRGGSVATLADYAWLISGLLTLYAASDERQWLDWALAVHEKQDELFLDRVSGAYFEAVADDGSLLFRSKGIYDNALPSPNAIALSNLRRLSKLVTTAEQQQALFSQAEKLVSSFAFVVNQNPSSAASLLAVELRAAVRPLQAPAVSTTKPQPQQP